VEKESQKRCEDLECPKVDDYFEPTSGVLLSHQIEYYANKYFMIQPFDRNKLKPAGYYLSVGKEYSINGEVKKLSREPGKDELIIEPFQVAIISTGETINLPRFMIARWNLRVTYCYKGLLWTGALQVDPGWCGQLFCPIYNLSNERVPIKLGEKIALMDFVKTTPFKDTPFEEGGSKLYDRPPQRKTLGDYNWKLKSALFSMAEERIKKIESDMDDKSSKIEQRMNRAESITGIMFTSIAILFAGLSILVTSANVAKSESLTSPYFFWTWLGVGLSILAIVFSTYNYFSRKGSVKKGKT
jgi:deoxycytidine triphosphate deaminase